MTKTILRDILSHIGDPLMPGFTFKLLLNDLNRQERTVSYHIVKYDIEKFMEELNVTAKNVDDILYHKLYQDTEYAYNQIKLRVCILKCTISINEDDLYRSFEKEIIENTALESLFFVFLNNLNSLAQAQIDYTNANSNASI